MISLEEKLRPRADTPSAHLRDVLVWMMLVAVFVALLPVWWVDGDLVSSLGSGEFSDFSDVIERFSRLMLSFWLLPAMGFMLALRCGAVDLSVWATAGLGGVVSAAIIGAGCPAPVAIFAGISAGAICGLINGTLVAGLRLPCPIISTLIAFGLIWLLGRYFPSGEIVLGDGALSGLLGGFQSVTGWLGLPEVTLQAVAALVVFIFYTVTMLVILNGEIVERHRGRGFSERWRLLAALTASGALSAAGGVSWLIEHKTAPVPGRPLDDFVIPAAALLAGGLYLAGRGRTLLAGVLLPTALAVVTGWRQEVLNLRCDLLAGYPLQVLCLVVMVAVARYAMTCAAVVGRCHTGALVLAWSSSIGIALFAASVWTQTPEIRDIWHATGGGLWLAGAIGAIVLRLASPRREVE
ncbi:MAG: hypothetical protein QGH60_04045 [Phycisphaerae bacterium]|jgi:ribose/xylose/arabinose/galactoside ABC-type transport system permease subunit|nr:hypothetical protein [Phycisphaerae bacterium]